MRKRCDTWPRGFRRTPLCSHTWAQVMRLAAKLGMVIQIHTNAQEMRYLAERFPENTIVFPHLGSGKKEIDERFAIVAAHRNCSIDVSGSGIERVGILEKAVKEIGSDRVLYGSDFTINEPSAVIARIDNAFLTAEDRENIDRKSTRLNSSHIPLSRM